MCSTTLKLSSENEIVHSEYEQIKMSHNILLQYLFIQLSQMRPPTADHDKLIPSLIDNILDLSLNRVSTRSGII